MNDDGHTSNVSDFDLERSTNEAWVGFGEKLAEVVSMMDDGATLNIGEMMSGAAGGPYVRFRCLDHGRLLAEASSNADLADGFRLTDEQIALMQSLGWHAPDERGGRPGSDFWQQGDQEDPTALVEDAVSALRSVYGIPHPAFLAPDQLAEILTPAPVEQVPTVARTAGTVAHLPRDWADLDAMIEAELSAIIGHPPLRDSDGDFALRVGSTMVFVRPTSDAQEVLLFSGLVHEVEGRSRAMEVLSDLNTDARYVRFMLIRDRVFVTMSILAQPFVPEHLRQALRIVSVISDNIDDDLAAKLHGRTTFTEDDPPEEQ